VFGIELDSEAARIARHFRRIAAADHGRETYGQRRFLARFLEQARAGVLGCGFVADLPRGFELAITDESARMNDSLRDPFAVKMADLLQKMVVLQRGRAAATHCALRLIVANRMTLTIGQNLAAS